MAVLTLIMIIPHAAMVGHLADEASVYLNALGHQPSPMLTSDDQYAFAVRHNVAATMIAAHVGATMVPPRAMLGGNG